MTPTDESLALLIDPAREVLGWWWNEYIVENHRQRFTGEVTYKGPPFSRSPVACFQWVTPVLLELGCSFEWCKDGGCDIYGPDIEAGHTVCISDLGVIGTYSFETANTRALEWAHNNMPERLAEAVRRVREKNRE